MKTVTEFDLKPLPRKFYYQDTLTVAKSLLGKKIVRIHRNKILSGIIVETEAYTGNDDPSCHSFNGMTKRNEVMFNGGGFAYIYFIYGNYYCFNVTTSHKGAGHAVLIRGIEPIEGINEMKLRRNQTNITELTNGPGKLCQSLAIDKTLNAIDVTNNDKIFITEGITKKFSIGVSPRIGISKAENLLYRFFIIDNEFITRHKFNKLSQTI